MTAPTDAELMSRSLHDPDVFGELFRRHAQAVFGFVWRRVGGQRATADELTAEVFSVAFTSRAKFDTRRPSARPWLIGIANNVVRHHWRGLGRGAGVDVLVGAGDNVVPFRADQRDDGFDPSIEALAIRLDAENQREALLHWLAGLSDTERSVVLAIALDELTYAETAEALALPIGTVKSTMARLRRRATAPG